MVFVCLFFCRSGHRIQEDQHLLKHLHQGWWQSPQVKDLGSFKLGQLLHCNSSLPVYAAFTAKDFGFKGQELFWNTVISYLLFQTSFKSAWKENSYLPVNKQSLWTYSSNNSHKAPKGLQHKLHAPHPFKNIIYILGKIEVLELHPLYSASSELVQTQYFLLSKVTTAEHVCLAKEELHRFI